MPILTRQMEPGRRLRIATVARLVLTLGFVATFGHEPAVAVAAGGGGSRRARPPRDTSLTQPELPPIRSFVPSDLSPGERRPLLLFLHGLGGSGSDAFQDIGLDDIGRRHRVFVVAPDGTADGEGRRFWNASNSCCNLERLPVDDLARLRALIDAWRARPDVDPNRVYVIGFSNGGFMAHQLACHLSDRLAGIASLAGAGPSSGATCAVSSPLLVIQVHGDHDPVVRYEGGRVFDSPDLAPHPSASETIKQWARRLGCRGPSTPVPSSGSRNGNAGAAGSMGSVRASPVVLDLDPRFSGPETQIDRYTSCRLGGAQLWTIRGGSHGVGTSGIVESVWRELARFKKN